MPDNLFYIPSFTRIEVLSKFNFANLKLTINRELPPFFTDETGAKRRVIPLNYDNFPKDGDIYFCSGSPSVVSLADERNGKITCKEFYGMKEFYNDYLPCRILKRKRIG